MAGLYSSRYPVAPPAAKGSHSQHQNVNMQLKERDIHDTWAPGAQSAGLFTHAHTPCRRSWCGQLAMQGQHAVLVCGTAGNCGLAPACMLSGTCVCKDGGETLAPIITTHLESVV